MALAAMFDFARKDIDIKQNSLTELLFEKHSDYIKEYEDKKQDYEYIMAEYLRMSGVYWCLTSIDLMGALERMSKGDIIDFVLQCFDQRTGGFAASQGHDPHLLHTLSAIQILALYDSLDKVDVLKVSAYITNLQREDGSFAGDEWGEIDTRFSFCAIACLALLNRLPKMSVPHVSGSIDVQSATEYILKCQNFDGGFGTRPGSESHSGQIYCCVGALSILGQLERIDADRLGWWLCERQLPSGGLNGRPEKLPDVCYSWWVLASLAVLGRIHWVDKECLIKFILACQDEETGGFADRPGDMPDPFHTVFGLAGLSLLKGDDRLKPVNPVFCMPQETIDKLGVTTQLLKM